MDTAKITFKLVQSFSVGFTVFAPSLNGLCVEINAACFSVLIWNRGSKWFAVENYWIT